VHYDGVMATNQKRPDTRHVHVRHVAPTAPRTFALRDRVLDLGEQRAANMADDFYYYKQPGTNRDADKPVPATRPDNIVVKAAY
jgi:hypothetical protein